MRVTYDTVSCHARRCKRKQRSVLSYSSSMLNGIVWWLVIWTCLILPPPPFLCVWVWGEVWWCQPSVSMLGFFFRAWCIHVWKFLFLSSMFWVCRQCDRSFDNISAWCMTVMPYVSRSIREKLVFFSFFSFSFECVQFIYKKALVSSFLFVCCCFFKYGVLS